MNTSPPFRLIIYLPKRSIAPDLISFSKTRLLTLLVSIRAQKSNKSVKDTITELIVNGGGSINILATAGNSGGTEMVRGESQSSGQEMVRGESQSQRSSQASEPTNIDEFEDDKPF